MPNSELRPATDTIASTLAAYVTSFELDAVPVETRESARLRVLDIVGIIVGSREHTGASALRDVVSAAGGTPEATLIGSAERLSASAAALVNGTYAHAADFDDTHHASRIHPSTVIVPAALAEAEARGADGATTLKGVIAGLEVAVRTGMMAPGRFHERGLHATSLCGVMGAAVAASVIAGSDARTTTHALGIAGSLASGLREAYLGEPTDTKALHAGWAAQAGIQAARLAAGGFSGPTTVYEGRFGYAHAYLSPETADTNAIVADLGTHWYTPEIVFKLYPCGSLIHAMIDAAIELHDTYHLSPDAIAEVVCIAPPGMVSTVLEPLEQKLAPQSGYHAKFSAQYAVAAALHDGTVTEASFAEERVHDPALRGFLQRVRYETDPDMPWPHAYPGGVRITDRGGNVHEVRVPNSPGSPDRPATNADLIRKFAGNAQGALTQDAIDTAVAAVLELEQQRDLTALMRALQVD